MDIQVLITKMKQIQGELKTDIQGPNTKMKQIQGELKIQGVNMEMKQIKGDFQNPITYVCACVCMYTRLSVSLYVCIYRRATYF